MKTIHIWIARLGQTRLTLVLSLLVLFTFLHMALLGYLRWTVDQEIASFKSPIRTLNEFKRSVTDPVQNAAPYYQAAVTLCTRAKTASSAHLDEVTEEKDMQKLASTVAAYAPVFDLMDQADSRPECAYDYRYEQGFSMQCPNFLSCRRLAFLLAARIRVEAHKGNNADACRVAAEGLRWMRTFEPNNSLICLMIRISLTKTIDQALKEVPAAQLTAGVKAEAQMLKLDLEKSWDLAFVGERLCAEKLYDSLSSGKDTWENVGSAAMAKYIYPVGGRALLLLDELAYLNMHRQIVEQTTFTVESAGVSQYFLIANMLTPNPTRAHKNVVDTCSELAQLSGMH